MNAFFRIGRKMAVLRSRIFETTGYLKVDKAFKFDMMIVDEAHYIKNAEARRTQNVIHLSEHTDRILFMTGTALENKVDEMISLVRGTAACNCFGTAPYRVYVLRTAVPGARCTGVLSAQT